MSIRSTALTLITCAFVCVSISAAQGPAPPLPATQLDPDHFTLRLILGAGDETPQDWSGHLVLDKGEIAAIEGLRFRDGDLVVGRNSWMAKSCLTRKAPALTNVSVKAKTAGKSSAKNRPPPKAAATLGGYRVEVAPNGVIVALKNVGGAKATVETAQGKFVVNLDRLVDGSIASFLDDRVRAQRVLPHAPLLEGPGQQDFPTAAADRQGSGAWVVAVWHEPNGPELSPAFERRAKSFTEYVPAGGGDQVRLLHFQDGTASPPLDVTEPGRDVWRPAVATAGDGSVIVVWTEKRGDNWDLFSHRYEPRNGSFGPELRITEGPGPDTDAVLATAADGTIWMAWQAWTGGQADILLAALDSAGKPAGQPLRISDSRANEWAPSIAVDAGGRIHVAYDTYQAGNYDVLLRTREPDGTLSQPITVAGTPSFEARPSAATDQRGRVWIAYEERTPDWGKDAVNLLDGKGSSLYRASKVVVVVVDGGRVLRAPDPRASAPEPLKFMNSYPRLLVDRAGRPWLEFRHRDEAVWGANTVIVTGAVWTGYVTHLSGTAWSAPQPLTRSDGLLDNRPALVQPRDGPVLAFYSTDGRLRREVEMNPRNTLRYFSNQGTPPGVFNVDLEVSALVTTGPMEEPRLTSPPPAASVGVDRGEDLSRIRGYRIEAVGKTYRLLRGEFHRHTEISADGGSDGSLEDMWRYALDAAGLDWIGNGDHDNGGGKEYTWWLIQKTTDLYCQPPRFVTVFSYERSVTYPRGHRNIMFGHRGVRTLPRLINSSGVVDEDTLMLYDYLKEHNGICAMHTSATGMGTDWRNLNPRFEPFVEIYQGHRQSYEHLGAPRSARRGDESIGGWQPQGMVWNALAMQYMLGFQASSDHVSTHMSYAVALAEDATRTALLDAFRRRHCYAATDNIVMDVRSGEHVMGDEFTADAPVKLKIFVRGTNTLARVDIIKDFKYVYSTEPAKDQVEFQWTDDERGRPAGLSWYYVRAIQADGELAWASPIWVHTQ
jgi:hypothetical protein